VERLPNHPLQRTGGPRRLVARQSSERWVVVRPPPLSGSARPLIARERMYGNPYSRDVGGFTTSERPAVRSGGVRS
jgi:hypothetical protein